MKQGGDGVNCKLANKIESVIKACCVGGGGLNDPELMNASTLIAYKLSECLEGEDITDKDWTLICLNIQSGFAGAASRAVRILAASCDIGVITS